MVKWHRDVRARALAAGFDSARIEHGGKHLRLIVGRDGRERMVTVSATPSDRRTLQNMTRDLRAVARTLGPAEPQPIEQHVQHAEHVQHVAQDTVLAIQPESAPPIAPIAAAVPDILFHHSSNVPLPWVIADGALAPLPDEFAPAFKLFGRDYLWATTSPDGDRCSTDGRPPAMAAYREGRTLRVRYTFSREGFLPWREALEANGQHALADAMLQYARHCGENPDKWFVRPDPLPLDDCLYVQVRSYRSHRWIELGASDLSEAGIVGFKVHDDAPVGDLKNGSYFGVTLGDRTYFGRRYISRGGRTYDVGSINTAALLKYADLR